MCSSLTTATERPDVNEDTPYTPWRADGIDKVRRQWEHLRIPREQAENERRQRQELADLYDEGGQPRIAGTSSG